MNIPGAAMFKEGVRRLLRQNPAQARGVVDVVAKKISGAVPHARDEIWVTGDNTPVRIGDMDRDHLVHALAMVVREARNGYVWVMRPDTGKMVMRRTQ